MEYRNLGRSGLRVSAVGLGCNNLGRPGTGSESPEGAAALVGAALDAGITLFDTADIYGGRFGLSEELLGAALQGRRDEAIIATKFGHSSVPGDRLAWQDKGSRRYIRLAVEDSLRRLRTDYIDLYQLHTPDPHTPIEETLAALDELVREGKVRYVGHTNLPAWQIADAAHVAAGGGWTPFVSAQDEYSLMERRVERDVLPASEHFGLGFLPYFPLAKGLLTGKVTRAQGAPAGTRLALSARDY